MAKLNYRRPLYTLPLAENFVKSILGINHNYDKIAKEIERAELTLNELERHPTATHEDHRDIEYRSSESREYLHQQILGELITEERLEDDEEIKLGVGGARPKEVKCDAQAYIVSGAPASGKSSIAAQLALENGAYILDSDYAKRKFPEYSEYEGGASLVHKESDPIIFSKKDSLLEYCIYQRYNIVIPLVGRTEESMDDILETLISANYQVHMINVALDRQKCVLRAYYRYSETKRYVPLSYVFDEVGNEPERVYYVLKRSNLTNNKVASFAQLSTDTPRGEPPKLLEATPGSPILSWKQLTK